MKIVKLKEFYSQAKLVHLDLDSSLELQVRTYVNLLSTQSQAADFAESSTKKMLSFGTLFLKEMKFRAVTVMCQDLQIL